LRSFETLAADRTGMARDKTDLSGGVARMVASHEPTGS